MSATDARDDEPPAVRPELAQARRRVKRHRIALVVGVLLVTVVLGLLLGLTSWARPARGSEPSATREAVGTALLVVGFVSCIVTGVRARRAGALRLAWNSPTVTLSRADHKRLLARIRADGDVPEADYEDAVALAGQVAKQRFLVPAYSGLAVALVGESLVTSTALSRWIYGVGFVLMMVGLLLMTRDSRRAQRWLDHRPLSDV